MELFVINRPEEDEPKTDKDEEKEKLDKILKRIEKKKQQRIKQREREKSEKNNKIKKPVLEEIQAEPLKITEKIVEKLVPNEENLNDKIKKSDQVPSIEGFTVLGETGLSKKSKVKRVLPKWLSNPTVISSNLQNLTTKVSKLKLLDKQLRHRLKSNGIKFLFPVQAQVIPWLLQVNKHSDVMFPNDICVSAPTGSGKTLAFVLPLVQALKNRTVRKIRALVILPTQDLASQVFKTFKTYTQDTNLETGLITGKNSFSSEQHQIVYFDESFGYVNKIDILVCTAGRLVQHLKSTKGFNLQSLEFIVIDEADRVLDNVQDDWLYHLEKHIHQDESSGRILNIFSLRKHRPPQKLLFSATLSQDPEKLQKLSLFQPKLFTCVVEENSQQNETENDTFIGKYTTPRELTEKYIVCSKDLKPLILYNFVKTENLTKTIVFTHSIESAHRLAILLRSLFKEKLKIEEISSSLKGSSREELINKFCNSQIDLLICTDALARGIDLPGIQCVISYSAPKYLKTYIHRAGRTARAGELGLSVCLVHSEQVSQFKQLLNQINKSNIEQVEVDESQLEHLGKLYKKSLNKLKVKVKSEENMGLKKLISKKKIVKKPKRNYAPNN